MATVSLSSSSPGELPRTASGLYPDWNLQINGLFLWPFFLLWKILQRRGKAQPHWMKTLLPDLYHWLVDHKGLSLSFLSTATTTLQTLWEQQLWSNQLVPVEWGYTPCQMCHRILTHEEICVEENISPFPTSRVSPVDHHRPTSGGQGGQIKGWLAPGPGQDPTLELRNKTRQMETPQNTYPHG